MKVPRDAGLWMGGAAFVLHLLWLGRQSVWVDEAYTFHVARLGAAQVVGLPEQTPPLYNLLMHAWTAAAGSSEWALRFPSAVLGAFAVWACHALALRFVGKAPAILATGLFALSGSQLHYSQTARTYALFTLATILSFLGLLRWLGSGRRMDLALHAAATTVMLYSHVFGLLFLLAQGVPVWLAMRRGPDRRLLLRGFAASSSVALLLFAPWTGILASRAQAVAQGFWIPSLSLETIKGIGWTFGIHYGNPWLVRLGTAFAFALAGWGLWGKASHAGAAKDPRLPGPRRENAATLAAAIGIPILVPLAASLALRPVFVAWYALPAGAFVCILVAAGCSALPVAAWRRVAAAVVVALFLGGALSFFAAPQGPDWRAAVHTLDAEAGHGDLVLNSFGFCDSATDQDYQCVLDYYSPRTDLRLVPFIGSYYRTMDANDTAALHAALAGRDHAWALYADPGPPAQVLRATLDSMFPHRDARQFQGVELVRYAA